MILELNLLQKLVYNERDVKSNIKSLEHIILFDVRFQHTLRTPRMKQWGVWNYISNNEVPNMGSLLLRGQFNFDIMLIIVLVSNSFQKLAHKNRNV